jgi:hypothetical protein
MLNFKNFLRSRRIKREDDVRIPRKPSTNDGYPDARTWPVIHKYLLEKNACPKELENARRLWLDYLRTISSGPPCEMLKAENAELSGKLADLQGFAVPDESAAGPCTECSQFRHTGRGALVNAYLRYKIIEFLQPHPYYGYDDGFQPLRLIGEAIESDERSEEILADSDDGVLVEALGELISAGAVIQTPFEPTNGDVMLGLAENLGKRHAAYEERKRLIADGAALRGLRAKWNADGTGWLETPNGAIAAPAGSVWDLLSYLNSEPEAPRLLN